MQRPDLSRLSETEKDALILTLFDIIGSKPPPLSSDGLKKSAANAQSLRFKPQRKVGGQQGHKGHTSEFFDAPDSVEIQSASYCEHRFHSLSDEDIVGFQARQVVDLPKLQMQTTEYRAM